MDRLLTLKETGKLLNVSKQTLQRWDNSGKLIAVRTEGGHRRYKLSDIEKIFNMKDEQQKILDKVEDYLRETYISAIGEKDYSIDDMIEHFRNYFNIK